MIPTTRSIAGSVSRARYLVVAVALTLACSGLAQAEQLIVGSRHPLTTEGGYHARWSPDSRQIAYTAGDWPNISIELISAEGGEPIPVPIDRSGDLYLSWHPDGEDLAFDGYNNGHDGSAGMDVYSVEISTGIVTRLTTVNCFGPHWSADGQRLSFSSGNADISSVAANGTDLRQHSSGSAVDYYPQWSPDGTMLAYSSMQGDDTDVWIVEVATGERTQFTFDPARDDRPVWSPDGKWLAWDSYRGGEHHVYARQVSGGEMICLTSDHGEAGMADWSPDGSAICYTADEQIWIAEISRVTPTETRSMGSLKARHPH